MFPEYDDDPSLVAAVTVNTGLIKAWEPWKQSPVLALGWEGTLVDFDLNVFLFFASRLSVVKRRGHTCGRSSGSWGRHREGREDAPSKPSSR